MRIISLPRSLATLFLLAVLSAPAAAAEPVSKSTFGGVAIDGHDTVAYHDPAAIASHTATEGTKSYVHEWKGATWRFATAASRDAFAADPERYSPAYNGHCANALSLGEGLIRTDGTHWEILDGQLYLFYAARGRDRWTDGNHLEYRAEADRAWSKILADSE